MKQIFLLSMPRSGSTLLNRLLASNENIATHAEPWFLLALWNLSVSDGVYARYSHSASSRAITDIKSTLSHGARPWDSHIRALSHGIYQDLAAASQKADAIYFLDKTPRYHLIADWIAEVFPNAKFIVLVRNPLSCLASGIDTWGNGQLKLHGQMIDLWEGPRNLANFIRLFAERTIQVKFEDLIVDAPKEVWRILDFLDLPCHENLGVSQSRISGGMGDPKVSEKDIGGIRFDPIEKYRVTLGSSYRKRFARKYIMSIAKDDLETLGYSVEALMEQIEMLRPSTSGLISDVFYHAASNLWRSADLGILRSRLRQLRSGERLYLHN